MGLRIGENSEERLRLRQRMAALMADEELLKVMDDAEIPIRFQPTVVLMQRKR